jgi:hypothetical protein
MIFISKSYQCLSSCCGHLVCAVIDAVLTESSVSGVRSSNDQSIQWSDYGKHDSSFYRQLRISFAARQWSQIIGLAASTLGPGSTPILAMSSYISKTLSMESTKPFQPNLRSFADEG